MACSGIDCEEFLFSYQSFVHSDNSSFSGNCLLKVVIVATLPVVMQEVMPRYEHRCRITSYIVCM